MTGEEFADKYGLVMVVDEILKDAEFHARLQGVEVKDGGVLIGAYGMGWAPDLAILNYWTQILGKTIVIDAYKSTRREIDVPRILDLGLE
jgi:hypothetical protein